MLVFYNGYCFIKNIVLLYIRDAVLYIYGILCFYI